jgi:hypothetical protein
MPLPAHWRFRPLQAFCNIVISLTSLLAGCGVSGNPQSVSIPALAAEDLVGPCRFDLSIALPSHPQRGVLVLYERGDTDLLYNDSSLRKTVSALDYSLVWAHQCNARSTGDIQADAGKGPGRMLVAALNQFSVQSGHPELATIGVVLYGFSAAGVLTATMANDQPDRLLGTIQYAAGSAYTDLNDVPVSAAASRIPALILANALDSQSGTERSLKYFQRGRFSGAPWAYAVQNDTTHCCNLSTRNIIIPWIEAIVNMNSTGVAYDNSSATGGAPANFVCTPDGVEDAQSDIDCDFTRATLGAAASTGEESAWLPSQTSGAAWLAWVTNPGTN